MDIKNKLKLFIVSNFNKFSAFIWGLHRLSLYYPKGVKNIMKFLGKIQLYQTFVFAQFFVCFCFTFQFSRLWKNFFILRKYNLQWNEKGFWEFQWCEGSWNSFHFFFCNQNRQSPMCSFSYVCVQKIKFSQMLYKMRKNLTPLSK